MPFAYVARAWKGESILRHQLYHDLCKDTTAFLTAPLMQRRACSIGSFPLVYFLPLEYVEWLSNAK
jgi:hypothetical protein